MRAERRGRGHLISFWFLFSMCLLNTYSMPSTVLGVRHAEVSKTRQVSSHGVCMLGEGEEEGQIPYTQWPGMQPEKSEAHRQREGK